MTTELITVFVGSNFKTPDSDNQSIDTRLASNPYQQIIPLNPRLRESNRIFILYLWISAAFCIIFSIISSVGTIVSSINFFQDILILESMITFLSIGCIIFACLLSFLTGILVCLIQPNKGKLYKNFLLNLSKFYISLGQNIKYAAFTALLALFSVSIGLQALKMTTENIGLLHYESEFQKTITDSYKNPLMKLRWINFQAKNKCCGTINIDQAWILVKNNPNRSKIMNSLLNNTEISLFQLELEKPEVSSHIIQYFVPKLTDLHYYPCPVKFGYQISCTVLIEYNVFENSRKILLFGYLLLSNLIVMLVLVFLFCIAFKNMGFLKLEKVAHQHQQVLT